MMASGPGLRPHGAGFGRGTGRAPPDDGATAPRRVGQELVGRGPVGVGSGAGGASSPKRSSLRR